MFIVTMDKIIDRSEMYALDVNHQVSIRFISSDRDAAISKAKNWARIRRMKEDLPQNHAIARFVNDRCRIAVLDIPEGEVVSVLAAPVIHSMYYE